MKAYRFLSQALLCLFLAGVVTSCKQNPKELGTVPVRVNSGVEDDHKNIVMDVHQIRVQEAYPSSKYLYLRVQEGDRSYWVATGPAKVNVGEIYFYNEALVKANFESKEMEKVFDTIYLVTQLVPESHGMALKPTEQIAPPPKLDESGTKKPKFHSSGMGGNAKSLAIAELLEDPETYEGALLQIEGICTKINTGILGRNWIHLEDPDEKGKKVVLTSQEIVSPGDKLTFRAQVTLNRDFGAGYTYEVLLEQGILVE